MTRVCVFGAGAVGGNIAANLAKAGLDVSVVARGPHLEAIRTNGLRLVSDSDDFTVQLRASDDPESLGRQDLVIVTAKAHSVAQSASSIVPLLGPDTPVVFALNGIPWWYFYGLESNPSSHETRDRTNVEDGAIARLDPLGRLRDEIGAHRAIGCVIRSPNEIQSPGVVRSKNPTNTFVLGEPTNRLTDRLERIAGWLKPGLPGVSTTTNIRGEIWKKLLVNVPSSTLSVLTQSSPSDIFANPETRALYARLTQEVREVANAYGESPDVDIDDQVRRAKQSKHAPSMLQDLRAGRPLEIDAQLIAVRDLARRASVATPLFDALLPLLLVLSKSGSDSSV